jgi:hypothetical protein
MTYPHDLDGSLRARRRAVATATRALVGTAIILAVAGWLATGPLRPDSEARGEEVQEALRRIVIALHVYEVGEFRRIPPIDWYDGTRYDRGLCFDKPALDAETGQKVGEVTECFLEARPEDDGFAVRNVSFIELPGGTIVARHRTTLRPTFDPDSPATHVVGACPAPEDLNVIRTTGRFRGFTGSARIVGLVNLENFKPGAESGIKFHEWLYLIQLHRTGR